MSEHWLPTPFVVAHADVCQGVPATPAASASSPTLPAWVLKVRGRHQFLLDHDEPIALNEYVRARLREGASEVELVLVDTARCKPSLAQSIEQLTLAARARDAMAAVERSMSVDERLTRDADDARIWHADT